MVASDSPTAQATEGVAAEAWAFVEDLSCELTVEIPVSRFALRDLAGMQKGIIVNVRWRLGNEVPVRVNGLLIGWGEFELKDGKLAVRLNELVNLGRKDDGGSKK